MFTRDDLLKMNAAQQDGPKHIEILTQTDGEEMAKMIAGDAGGIDAILKVLYDNLHITYLRAEFEDRRNEAREIEITFSTLGAKK